MTQAETKYASLWKNWKRHETDILLIVSNQKQTKKVWHSERLRGSLLGAFSDVHYGQLVAYGNFFFLDQTQEADETCARLWNMILSFTNINDSNLCQREVNEYKHTQVPRLEILTWQVYCFLSMPSCCCHKLEALKRISCLIKCRCKWDWICNLFDLVIIAKITEHKQICINPRKRVFHMM